MLISTAITLARNFTRNGGDLTYYPNFALGHSIQAALSELTRRTTLLPRTDQITLTANSSTFTGLPAGFRPDRLRQAFLSGSNVQVAYGAPLFNSYQYVEGGPNPANTRPQSATLGVKGLADTNDRIIAIPGPAQPSMIAFNSWTSGVVWPIPDQNYTLNFLWYDFPTNWTPGYPLIIANLSGGTLESLTVNNKGENLTGAAITFQGGGGTGAAATATLANEAILTTTVASPGSGYTSAPDVYINGILCTDVDLNIPLDLLRPALMYGAPAFLQHNDPEHAFATPSGKKFNDWVESLVGNAGGMGEATVTANRRRH